MSDEYVVDTNVLLAADAGETARLATHVPLACRLEALDWLTAALAEKRRLVVDDAWRILNEYQNKLRSSDFGSQFLRQAFSMQLFVHVSIEFDSDGHAKLPTPLEAVVHDRSDRKFVAASLAVTPPAPIVNCADSDWYDWEEALHAHDVRVCHLCEPRRKKDVR